MGSGKVCCCINIKLINIVDMFITPEILKNWVKLLENISMNIKIIFKKIENYSSKIAINEVSYRL